jgi:hypothetical protein
MIVRISGEGQYRLSSAHLDSLNKLDNELVGMIATCDESHFRTHLSKMVEHVRASGEALPADSLEESNIILPPADISLDEARALFTGEGLVPG